LAINDYEKIDEDKYHLLSQKMYEKLLICDWSDYEENVSKLKTKINQGGIVRNPFTPLLTLDDPELQLKTSKNLANQIYPENNILLAKFCDEIRNYFLSGILISFLGSKELTTLT
jgi:hypothetical protein